MSVVPHEGTQAQVFTRDGRVMIRIPMAVRKRSGRTEIIMPKACSDRDAFVPKLPSALAVALARALRWAEMLDKGLFPTVAALAAAVGLERSYVARVLNLSLLAPDVVEAILRGQEPSGLSLTNLRDDLPMEWPKQRTVLGFD